MAETIAVLSLKGGTGKTTTVRTLADVLRRIELDVLAVDLDPQGNLSDYFDVPATRPPPSPTSSTATPRPGGRARRDHPRDADPRRGRALDLGPMGRELVLKRRSRRSATATTSSSSTARPRSAC